MLSLYKAFYHTFFIISFYFLSIKSYTQNTFIPDDHFEQALIDLGYDTLPLDDYVPTSNIIGISDLDLTFLNISDLTGLEDFTNLTVLNCANNLLSTIDTSKNIKLKQLYCQENLLIDLNLTQNTNLEIFWCYNNTLKALDVTQNLNLISLVCNDNNLSSIDLSNNINLIVFNCDNNQIQELDLSNNLNINRFQCKDNLLTYLNINTNRAITFLDCSLNQLQNLDVTNNLVLGTLICNNNNITSLDLTKNHSLSQLNCSNNNICRLNIKNQNNANISIMNFEFNPDLNCIIVDNLNEDHTYWEPTSFINYAETIEQCNAFIPVDTLDDFIGSSYTLPALNAGYYFTESGGLGTTLNAGEIITKSQTIYIYNMIACNSNESNFNILISNHEYFIPKYFTPNNDGTHDLWKITDHSNLVNTIYIYNKHGKLIKFISQNNSEGWDGTFNGKLQPSDSYWYEIFLNNKEVIRGFFALKR